MILRKSRVAGAAALAAAVLAFGALLPPRAARLAAPPWRPAGSVVNGVFHLHTTRSDGTGTVDEVAAAAARAGLQFLIVTDHGDGTRLPDRPAYRSGVLCIDGVEISTNGGHYAAVGLGRAPYPLAGEPRDVVEDVRRLGGFGVVTHPFSQKRGLAWRDWQLPFDGIEWLSGDSQWREASIPQLAAASLTYFFRPVETLARMLRRPGTIARWDAISRVRPVVAVAGSDAHARIGFKDGVEPYESHVLLKAPSYQAVFGAFSLQLTLAAPLSGRPAEDAAQVIAAFRSGHLHTVIQGRAAPAAFEFIARSGPASAVEGDSLPLTDPVSMRVRANIPHGGWLVLYRDGVEVHRVRTAAMVYASDRPGTYRAEAWLPGASSGDAVPWIVGNAIRVGLPPAAATEAGSGSGEGWSEATALAPGTAWAVERDPASSGRIQREGSAISLEYRLAAGRRSPYVAAVASSRIPEGAGGVRFRASAAQPMRVSVQVRAPNGRDVRWVQSVYLDASPRQVTVPFPEMIRTASSSPASPALPAIDSLLFVVDTVNTAPGSAGSFTVEDVGFVRRFAQGRPAGGKGDDDRP